MIEGGSAKKTQEIAKIMTSSGIVYLLGAGPGDPNLLTLQGIQVLQTADVLVYDALIHTHILNFLPVGCERIQMGKRGRRPSVQQSQINQILIAECQKGKTVVRLKSGDPFVFGRCRAELQALHDANCRVCVLPGLSTAIAGPTLAGIPLTDPVLSPCFAVVSAHQPDQLDWQILAQLNTLVILMGTQTLDEILAQLQNHGKADDTPVAILQWVSQPDYREWRGTLATIATQTAGESLSPAIIVVGEVVSLRQDWANLVGWPELIPQTSRILLDPLIPLPYPHLPFPSSPVMASEPSAPQPDFYQPLAHQTILVTRAAGQSGQFSQQLTALGASVIEMPALEIQPPSSWQGLDAAILELPSFAWLILTSANAVNAVCDRIIALGKDLRSLAGVKIAVVGAKTAAVLAKRGLVADYIPPDFVADALIAYFPEPIAGQSFLFPRVETGGRDILVKSLSAAGGTVTEVAAYESGCPAQPNPQAIVALCNKQVTIITFASSKTVQCFAELIGAEQLSRLEQVQIASIGPQTSQACQAILGRVDIEARDYTLDGLAQAIVQAVQEKKADD